MKMIFKVLFAASIGFVVPSASAQVARPVAITGTWTGPVSNSSALPRPHFATGSDLTDLISTQRALSPGPCHNLPCDFGFVNEGFSLNMDPQAQLAVVNRDAITLMINRDGTGVLTFMPTGDLEIAGPLVWTIAGNNDFLFHATSDRGLAGPCAPIQFHGKGFVVAPVSRDAMTIDFLAIDEECRHFKIVGRINR